jgi:hypothetical protein
MRVSWAVPLALAVLPTAVSADLYVKGENQLVTIRAHREPLSRVLTGIARETGIAVVYQSPAPSQLVSLSLENVTPQEALIRLFDGQGLNYIFQLDPSGSKVAMLIVAGTSGTRVAASSSARPPGSSNPMPAAVYEEEPPPGEEEPEPDEEMVEQPPEEIVQPPDTNLSGSVWNPPGGPVVMPTPPPGAFPGGGVPTGIATPYPVQPGFPNPNFPGGVSMPQPPPPTPPRFPGGVSQPQD